MSLLFPCLLLALACLVRPATAAWGATPVSNSLRPDESFISQFPTTDTVVVQAGESISSKISECDAAVGSGFCRVRIAGQPSAGTLTIFRSKTMLVGTPGLVLTFTDRAEFVRVGSNTNQVVIQGLEISGHASSYLVGVEVEGSDISHVAIKGCKIYGFRAGGGNAHGIIVRGKDGNSAKAVRHIIIDGNTVFDMQLGSSEAIAINGNVRRWVIKNNDLWDLNNIGIDAIGGEGTAPTKTLNGVVFPGDNDAARQGWIEDNFVENVSTVGNPAYNSVASWAAAIYVDGGRDITIRDNVVERAAWAYEIGGENCIVTENIFMTGNSAVGSYYGDFVLGGYSQTGYVGNSAINCNPATSSDVSEGHGSVRKVTAKSNTFSSTGVQEAVVLPQYRITETVIVHPSITPVNTGNNGFAPYGSNAIKNTE